MHVRRGEDELVAANGEGTLGPVEDIAVVRGGNVVMELPEQIPVARIERLHRLTVVPDVEDTVVHQRREFGKAVGVQAPGPGHLQVLHVVAIDLVERTVAPGVVGAAPHQPIVGRWFAQHRIGDGSDPIERRAKLLQVHLRSSIDSYSWAVRDGQNFTRAVAAVTATNLVRHAHHRRCTWVRLPAENLADESRRTGGQCLSLPRHPIALKDERQYGKGIFTIKRSGTRRRHGLGDSSE
jgi:hypothetical protein